MPVKKQPVPDRVVPREKKLFYLIFFSFTGTGFVTKAFLDNHTRMVHAGISLANIQISKVPNIPPKLHPNSAEKLPNSIPPNPTNLQKVVEVS